MHSSLPQEYSRLQSSLLRPGNTPHFYLLIETSGRANLIYISQTAFPTWRRRHSCRAQKFMAKQSRLSVHSSSHFSIHLNSGSFWKLIHKCVTHCFPTMNIVHLFKMWNECTSHFSKQTTKDVLCTFGVIRGVGSHYPLDSNEFLWLLSCFPNKRKKSSEGII